MKRIEHRSKDQMRIWMPLKRRLQRLENWFAYARGRGPQSLFQRATEDRRGMCACRRPEGILFTKGVFC